MGTLTLLASVLTLSALTYRVNAQDLHHQIGDLNKYGYNVYPVAATRQNYVLTNNYARNYPVVQNQQIAHNRAGYSFGNNYGGPPKNIPLYPVKKVTTVRKIPVKKQPPKYFNSVPPFKQGQLNGGKPSNFGPKPIGNPGYGQNNHINWVKGSGNKNNFNNFDFAKSVNHFNKQIDQFNTASLEQKFKPERAPRFNNEGSFSQNSKPFEYIPVNLDSKINNFNSDLKVNNNGLNSWNQNKATAPKSEPVTYQTFVPGVSNFDASTGKIHNPQNFDSFHGQGKGGDPSSFVKVTNGDVTYTYHIRHLPNRH